MPFKSVDGTLITSGTQNNALYSRNTTNEVDFARTGADGKGQEFFEVQTANEAPHLGCGVPVTAGGRTTPRSCWLVIVPQGHLDLDGKPYADTSQVNMRLPGLLHQLEEPRRRQTRLQLGRHQLCPRLRRTRHHRQ